MPHDLPQCMCPICEGTSFICFLYRERVPVHQNFLFDSVEDARGIARGTLDLQLCTSCGFVFNTAFDSRLLDYGPRYENAQTFSLHFSSHVSGLVHSLVQERGVRNGRVLEVGCGNGKFLFDLLSHPDNRSTGVGFDPAYSGPSEMLDGRLRFDPSFFGSGSGLSADVIISRHVIEHIERPVEFLRSIREGIGETKGARLFLETPCVSWILQHRVIWDFFYEHCSLFTMESLALALQRAGFHCIARQHVFGGQYLWLESIAQPAQPEPIDASCTLRFAEQFAAGYAELSERWMQLVKDLAVNGPTFVWGAGAKGVTFSNLIDPDARYIKGIVDINPAKQGMYLPGTGHRILGPAEAVAAGARHVLVLNPNYEAEVVQCVRDLAPSVHVINLMEKESIHAPHH